MMFAIMMQSMGLCPHHRPRSGRQLTAHRHAQHHAERHGGHRGMVTSTTSCWGP